MKQQFRRYRYGMLCSVISICFCCTYVVYAEAETSSQEKKSRGWGWFQPQTVEKEEQPQEEVPVIAREKKSNRIETEEGMEVPQTLPKPRIAEMPRATKERSCPRCKKHYTDAQLLFCPEDGIQLK